MERMKVEEVAPEVYKALMGLEQAVQASAIDKTLLHLVKLRASQINGCAFCMAMHTKEALRDGDHPDRVALLGGWRETDLFTAKEQAALAWTEAVTNLNTGHIGDDLYKRTEAEFPGRALADLTLLIIAINAWNRVAVPFHKKVVISQKMGAAA
ncbi:MAG TPA: carboxymuconolactone decarboxylase family protein [Alphaproteobacteria bacterium]|nr:carboxymuconolactone decarboxylase family protein [Alphaproteobacteria bacterium]